MASEREIRHARRRAIQEMGRIWTGAYHASKGEWDFAERQIRGGAIAQTGQLTAGLAGSGMLNTTAGVSAARGVQSDMNQQLMQLASIKSAAEYSKWMDLIDIRSNTEYEGITAEKSGFGKGLDILSSLTGIFGGGD